MYLAISSDSLSKNSLEAVEMAAGLGFRYVEMNLQGDEFGYGYQRKTNARFYRQLRQQLDQQGLQVWSVTLPPLTQEQMFYERARKDILLSAAIAAGTLGAKVLVVRPADIFSSEITFESYIRNQTAPVVIEGYDEAWAQVVNRRMTMALLNKDHWVGAPLTNQADRIDRATRDLAIGWAMDVRRALRRNDLHSWLAPAGERLAVAYVYDQEEEQLTPPLSDEWSRWLPVLAQTRLKCLVIQAPLSAGDLLTHSQNHLQTILTANQFSQ